LMVHPPGLRAFVHSVETRLFRICLSLVSERSHFRGGSFLVMLRPARWLARLTSPRRALSRIRQARTFTAELAPAGVSPNQSLLSLLGPTTHCRGGIFTRSHVKDRRLHVEWSGGASVIRLMTSVVSALSGIVANGHQAIHLVSSAPSIHSVRWVFPSTAGSQPCHRASFRNPSRLRLTLGLRFIRFWPFLIQASGTAAVPTGPWLSTVYHTRTCKRCYGLIRQPDELRPAWLSAYSGRSLPRVGAVRLAFPSFPCHALCVHAATPTPPTVRFHVMVHPPAIRAFVHSVGTRLCR
jgi:hypothetical protein